MKGTNPIQLTKIKNPLKTNITYSRAYEEIEACVAAGMDVERWDDPRPDKGYSRELKLKILAWNRLHGMVESHIGDTQVEKQKQERDKARKKR